MKTNKIPSVQLFVLFDLFIYFCESVKENPFPDRRQNRRLMAGFNRKNGLLLSTM